MVADFKLLSDMAPDDSNAAAASAVFADVLNAVISAQVADDASVSHLLTSSAASHGLSIEPNTQNEAVALFGELRALEYGPYSRGIVVQTEGDNQVRVVPAQ